MNWHLEGTSAKWQTARRAISVAACLAIALIARSVDAAILFSYEPSAGQLPTDQGWLGFEVDIDGPLTAASAGGAVSGTAANNANAAIENVGGVNVLHIRDTLTDSTADLPNYYYPWTVAQQQALIAGGLRFTIVAQALTNTASNSNVRFGFNGTEFETQFANINADQAVQVQSFGGASLFPLDGQFHTLVITGQPNGANIDFSYTHDGGAAVAMTPVTNPTPAAFESTVYFGGFSSAGRNSDLLVKSVVMETVPEPSTSALVLATACMGGLARRKSSLEHN